MRPALLRWLLIACGITVFLWLGNEDTATWPVAALGLAGGALLTAWWLWPYSKAPLTPPSLLAAAALAGALAGVCGALASVLLMFLKTAWHSHIFPDYPLPMMAAMAARAPAWAAAGAALALALVLWRGLAKEDQPAG
jgi:hypothetical protein